jgi:two-component system phosphate regulon sensor histidine kinase PhoR
LTERFYRVPDVKIKKIEGSGLGLAIVKYIAIRHGAEFNMSSILNKGTTTKIFFKKK